MNTPKNKITEWFSDLGISFLNYFETQFERNTMGTLKGPATLVKRFTTGTIVDKEKMADHVGQIMIDAIVRQRPILQKVELSLLPELTRYFLREAVAEATQHAMLNNQVWEKINASTLSTPNFTNTTDNTSWLLSSSMLGKIAWNLIELSNIGKFKIVGDDFVGRVQHTKANGIEVLKQWDNNEFGKDFGTFINQDKNDVIQTLTTSGEIINKYDWFTTKWGDEITTYRFDGGDMFDNNAWSRKDQLEIDGKRYLVYENFALVGEKGEPGTSAADLKGGYYDYAKKALIFIDKNNKEITVPFTAAPVNVRTVATYADVDLALKNILWRVNDMQGAPDIVVNAYDKKVFQSGERGFIFVDEAGTPNPISDEHEIQKNLFKLFGLTTDHTSRILYLEKFREDTIPHLIRIDDELMQLMTLVQFNADDIIKKMDMFDYSALTTQKELYDKVLADNILPGSEIKLDIGGVVFYARAVGLDTIKKEFVYEIEGDWYTSDGDHVTSFRKATAVGTSTAVLATPSAGIIQAQQFKAKEAATKDKHLVRFKEFKDVKDKTITNELAISVLKGDTFSLTSNSFIRGTAELLEHFAVSIPTVDRDGANANYATWEAALTDNLPLDTMFEPTTGDWITKPQAQALGFSAVEAEKIAKGAQWAKTYIVDAMVSLPVSKQPIKVDMSFRPYTSPLTTPPTIAKTHDELTLKAKNNLIPSRLLHEFLSLALYQESDGIPELQAIIDRASGAQPGDGFQVINVLKATGIASNTKFANGDPVNQQSAPAYDKANEDIHRKEFTDFKASATTEFQTIDADIIDLKAKDIKLAKDIADHVVDTNQALIAKLDKDGANFLNLVNANKWIKVAADGRLEFVDNPTDPNAAVMKYVDGANRPERVVLGENKVADNANTIMIVTNISDLKDVTFDTSAIYVNDGTTWILINPKHSSQGQELYTMITQSRDHHTVVKTWTEGNITGYWNALYTDDNFSSVGDEYHMDLLLRRDGAPSDTTYDLDVAYTKNQYKPEHFRKIFEFDPTLLGNPNFKVTLVLMSAYRSWNNKPTSDYIKTDMIRLNEYYEAPTPAKLQDLKNRGLSIVQTTEWDDVHFDTALSTTTSREILPTSNASLSSLKLFHKVTPTGAIEVFYSVQAGDVPGEDGYLAIPVVMNIEEVATQHSGADTARITALEKTVADNINKQLAQFRRWQDTTLRVKGNEDEIYKLKLDQIKQDNKIIDFGITQTQQDTKIAANVKTVDFIASQQSQDTTIATKVATTKYQTEQDTQDTTIQENTAKLLALSVTAAVKGLTYKDTVPAVPVKNDVYLKDVAVGSLTLKEIVIYDGTKEVKVISPADMMNVVVNDARWKQMVTDVGTISGKVSIEQGLPNTHKVMVTDNLGKVHPGSIVGTEVAAGNVGKRLIVDKNNKIALHTENPHPHASHYNLVSDLPAQSTYVDENGDTQNTLTVGDFAWVGVPGNWVLYEFKGSGPNNGWEMETAGTTSTHTGHWRKLVVTDLVSSKFDINRDYRFKISASFMVTVSLKSQFQLQFDSLEINTAVFDSTVYMLNARDISKVDYVTFRVDITPATTFNGGTTPATQYVEIWED